MPLAIEPDFFISWIATDGWVRFGDPRSRSGMPNLGAVALRLLSDLKFAGQLLGDQGRLSGSEREGGASWLAALDGMAADPANADFKALVDAAHARGMKVFMDIVVNHTADVIKYHDCGAPCAYRDGADYPYQRRGGTGGAPINPGFLGDVVQTVENFARLTDMDYAYQLYVRKGQEYAKVPEWRNGIRFYHNRGDSFWKGESITQGDFSGLDDVATEQPRVLAGFIEVFGGPWRLMRCMKGVRGPHRCCLALSATTTLAGWRCLSAAPCRRSGMKSCLAGCC